jgi:hypothetical protein
MPVIPAFWRPRKKDLEFKASLNNIVIPSKQNNGREREAFKGCFLNIVGIYIYCRLLLKNKMSVNSVMSPV